MLFWQALVIFLILLAITIGLIFINLFKKGKFVKNILAFSAVQVYVSIIAIIFIMYQSEGRIFGYLLPIIYILAGIGAIIIKKSDFFLSRLITIENILLISFTFWYKEYHMLFFFISIAVFIGTIGIRKFIKDRY